MPEAGNERSRLDEAAQPSLNLKTTVIAPFRLGFNSGSSFLR